MSFKTTVILFITACFLGMFIWLTDSYLNPTDIRKQLASMVLNMNSGDVSAITIEHGDFFLSCIKKDYIWYIDKPLKARADGSSINRILSILETIKKKEIITASQRANRELTLDDYGLLKPRARIILLDNLGKKEILIGNDAPIGEMLYVKLSLSEEVIAVSRHILEIIPENIETIRDKTIIHGSESRTSRLEIQYSEAGFIQLAKISEKWVIQQPIFDRADSGKISKMLNALYSLKIDDFIWDPNGKTLESGGNTSLEIKSGSYGLIPDDASARITVWVNGDKIGRELILGKNVSDNNKEIYAKLRGNDSIYAVRKNFRNVFSVTVNDLRDKNLFDINVASIKYVRFGEGDRKLILKKYNDAGWMVEEPFKWKADDKIVEATLQKITYWQIESFLDIPQTNLTVLGLDPPVYTVQILTAPPSPSGNKEEQKSFNTDESKKGRTEKSRLFIGYIKEEEGRVFVKFENNNFVYEISSAFLNDIGRHPADPLIYRDRTMLAIPLENIKQLSLIKNGKKQSVVKNDLGEWSIVGSATNQLNMEVIENILFYVANLRAIRIEDHHSENLADYGLNGSGILLKLGLCGDEGIQKSIIIGHQTETGGIYAMVQGQDVVFVLKEEVVTRLTEDFSKPPVFLSKNN